MIRSDPAEWWRHQVAASHHMKSEPNQHFSAALFMGGVMVAASGHPKGVTIITGQARVMVGSICNGLGDDLNHLCKQNELKMSKCVWGASKNE